MTRWFREQLARLMGVGTGPQQQPPLPALPTGYVEQTTHAQAEDTPGLQLFLVMPLVFDPTGERARLN